MTEDFRKGTHEIDDDMIFAKAAIEEGVESLIASWIEGAENKTALHEVIQDSLA